MEKEKNVDSDVNDSHKINKINKRLLKLLFSTVDPISVFHNVGGKCKFDERISYE